MRNDFFQHGGLKKGAQRSQHKYTARVELPNGKYLYFYDMKTYQNYLSKQGKTQRGQMAKKDPNEEIKKKISKTVSNTDLDNLIKNNSTKTSGTTLQQKTQEMQNNIEKGNATVKGLLAENYISDKKETTAKATETKTEETKKTETTKTEDTKATKKNTSSSKKSSSKKTSSGSKGTKGSSGSKSSGSSKKEKAAKEKSSSSKGSSEKKSEQQVEKAAKKKKGGYEESLKKMLGVKDDEVNEHASAKKFMDQLGKYKNGSHGYATVGGKTYRWTKEHGKITLIDVDTNKEVSINALQGSIREFQVKSKRR